MSNVLSEEKKQQVIALGKLGWPLRRIEQATGVRRETASAYLKSAGVVVCLPGWGHRAPSKPAIEVTTDPDASKPAIGVTTDFGQPISPAIDNHRATSACEPYRDLIERGLGRGRNAMAIWQDLVSDQGLCWKLPDGEALRSQASRPSASRSGRHHSHRPRRRGTGRLRQWSDGARRAKRQVSPHAIVRDDAGLQPQIGALASVAFEFAHVGRTA